MRLFILIICLTIFIIIGITASQIVPRVEILENKAALQRGAAFFMNYCSGCHSLRYIRYNQLVQDLGFTETDRIIDNPLLFNNLVLTYAKNVDPIKVSMPATDAREWFGMIPPDLSLMTKAKGYSWVVSYLQSFYADSSRPFGSNNLLVPDTAMPNVLAPLKHALTDDKFEQVVYDLVDFLDYVAEPGREKRYLIGAFVILFLFVFLCFSWKLKQSYWGKK